MTSSSSDIKLQYFDEPKFLPLKPYFEGMSLDDLLWLSTDDMYSFLDGGKYSKHAARLKLFIHCVLKPYLQSKELLIENVKADSYSVIQLPKDQIPNSNDATTIINDDKGQSKLSKSYLNNAYSNGILKICKIPECKLSEGNYIKFLKSNNITTLRVLDLSKNNLTDHDLADVCEIVKKLSPYVDAKGITVNLSHNPMITNFMFVSYSAFGEMMQLNWVRYVDVTNCSLMIVRETSVSYFSKLSVFAEKLIWYCQKTTEAQHVLGDKERWTPGTNTNKNHQAYFASDMCETFFK
jgi:hypothetical protein